MGRKWNKNGQGVSRQKPWFLLLLFSFPFSQSIIGCATTNEKRAIFDNYYHADGRFERDPNSVWEALKAFWSSYDSTPPSLSGWHFEQLVMVKGGELAVTIKIISFNSERPKQWRYLLKKIEELEAVAVRLDNHPYPSDPAEQKKLDRISQYISQLRIAGDLAEEALRHADAELLAEAKEIVKKAQSLSP